MKVSLLNLNLIGPDAIGSVIIKMARYYRDRGDEVRIFIGGPPRDVPDDIRQICRVVTLANLLRARPAAGDQEDLFFHLSDLTIYNYPGYYDLLETIHGRDRGAVLFAYYCVTPPELAGSEAERDLLVRGRAEAAHAHFADLSMVISPFGAEELKTHHGIGEDRVRVMPLFPAPPLSGAPASGETLAPGPKAEDLVARYGLDGAEVLLYVGRFAPNKDITTVIRALARFASRRPAAKLLLVGDDRTAPIYQAHAADLLALAKTLGIADRVVFTGPVDRIGDHFRLADVFVTASRHEGFCMPVVEAMTCGVPVVSSSSTALPSTVGDAGMLFEPGDVDGLARALEGLLMDEGARRRLSEAGLERARMFSHERFDERLEKLTHELMTHVSRVPRLIASAATPPAAKRIAVCGTGAEALRANDDARRRGDEIVCFVDDDERKQGRAFLGHPVIGFGDLAALKIDELIVSGDRRADIQTRLTRAGSDNIPLRAIDLAPLRIERARADVYTQAMRGALAGKGRSGREKVVIFGAGAGGQQAFGSVKRTRDVVAFADNDRKKHGTSVLGKPVIGVPQLAGMEYDRVVIASVHASEIKRQLFAAGIASDRIEVFGGR
jgi:glycosyltransferase involved in cell wall biosynthesis